MKWSPSQKPLPTGGLHNYRGSSVESSADPRGDADIDALPDWQQAICREVRDRSTPPTQRSPRPSSAPTARTSFQGNIVALLAKDHVNVFLYDPPFISRSMTLRSFLAADGGAKGGSTPCHAAEYGSKMRWCAQVHDGVEHGA
jgi:hypothetical protein